MIGGRYGLSSKEFSPGMVAGVFAELRAIGVAICRGAGLVSGSPQMCSSSPCYQVAGLGGGLVVDVHGEVGEDAIEPCRHGQGW